MPNNNDRWAALSMKDRAALIKMFLGSGVTSLSEMRQIYNEDIDHALSSDKEFVQRLRDYPNTPVIQNEDGSVSTHLMNSAEIDGRGVVWPSIQMQDGQLVDHRNEEWGGLDNAIIQNDTIQMHPVSAQFYAENYKKFYPHMRATGGDLGNPPPSPSSFDYFILEGGLWNPPIDRSEQVPIPLRPYATAGPIDREEIARRQRYAESTFDDKAVNKKSGAAGAYQIMPSSKKQFEERKHRSGDLLDYKYNREVRDYLMDWYSERPYLKAPTDSVALGKQLAAFNYGPGNVRKKLNKAKAAGIDIEDSWDWLSYMPQETQDYVNFILRNKDINGHKNNEAYRKALQKIK